MLSYKDYNKTKVKVELTLAQWDFVSHILRIHAKTLNENLMDPKKIKPYIQIADAIDDVTEPMIYGGKN